MTLPNIPIVTLHRSDSPGDTFLFTTYLSKTDPSGWGTKIGFNTTVPWPNAPGALGENGNSGMVTGCKATPGCIAYVGISYLTQAAPGRSRLRRSCRTPRASTWSRPRRPSRPRRRFFVKKTPANGTISLIYGAAKDGYPIINYEYAIVSTHQSSSSTAKNIRSVLEWALNPKDGSTSSYLSQVNFQALPSKVEAQSIKQVLASSSDCRRRCGGEHPRHPQAESVGKPPLPKRASDFARRNEETGWRSVAWVAVFLPLAALVFALTVLAVKALPAIRHQRLVLPLRPHLDVWRLRHGHPHRRDGHPRERSSARWPIIWGTIASSVIAIVIALPLSIGAAFALTERMPTWISRPLGFTIEILAGIPSVVIGLWGILTFGTVARHQRLSASSPTIMPDVPVLRYFRNPVGSGEGLLSAGIVLALMIVPIITSTTRDLFSQVPPAAQRRRRRPSA